MFFDRPVGMKGIGLVYWVLGWAVGAVCLVRPVDRQVWPLLALLALWLMARGLYAVRRATRRAPRRLSF